jgi:hypothetical protein
MFRRIVAQPTSVRVRSFATTKIARAGAGYSTNNPYTAFIKKMAADKVLQAKLNKLPFAQRGKTLGKLYHALPPAEKAKLLQASKKIKVFRKNPANKGPKRAPSAYNKFVKAKFNSSELKALPMKKRMVAIGKLWKAQQKK